MASNGSQSGNQTPRRGLTLCDGAAAYVALDLLWNVACNFLSPYVMGALAALDDCGRWAVAAEALWNGGTVPGPWIAGILVERGGYLPLAWLSLVTGAICMAMYTVALRRLQKQEDARGGGGTGTPRPRIAARPFAHSPV